MFKPTDKKVEVQVREKTLPSIFITTKALSKMQVYVEECSKEVGWLGTVTDKDGVYVISDVMLFKQNVTAVTTDITEEGLNEFANELLKEHGGEEGANILNSIKMWGHSHVNMGVFASGTDDAQMEVFGASEHNYFIRLIANKRGEMNLDLFDYKNGITYYNLKFTELMSNEVERITKNINILQDRLKSIREGEITSIKKNIQEEIKEKVTEKTYAKVWNGYNYGGTHYNYISSNNYKESSYVSSESNLVKLDDYEDWKGYESYSKLEIEGIEVDEWTLYEIASCLTEEEIQDILTVMGVQSTFTKKELNDIQDECIERVYGDL